MIKLTKGTDLLPATRLHVLRAFVNRCTVENNYPQHNPSGARMEPITDAQWLAEHAFYTRQDGALDGRVNHCEPALMLDEGENS